ncbi:MAG: DUF1214 domain-containing protein [Siculibacillus sp.]
MALRFLVTLLTAMAASLILGIGSAWYMIADPHTAATAIGPWRALPTIDAATADPYTRARVARSGETGMGAGEGLVFVAHEDGSGRPLEGSCDYVVSGRSPPSRLWTLSAVDAEGVPAHTPRGRAHVDGRSVLRDGDGRFEITVAATARAGNWLPSPARGTHTLMLRLYDTPVALSSGTQPELPRIERRGCR